MDALRLKNVRCIGDTGWVPIRPLTLVLGRNSSGKSSFVRWPQLLKQSWNAPGTAPFVWTAQDGVDFGSFSEALRSGANPERMGFGVQLTHRWGQLNLNVSLEKQENSTEIREIEIDLIDKVLLKLIFAPDGADVDVYINNRVASEMAPGWRWTRRGRGILPRVFAWTESESSDEIPGATQLIELLKTQKYRKMDAWRFEALSTSVDWLHGELRDRLAEHSAGTPTWRDTIRALGPKAPIFRDLLPLYALGSVDTLIDDLRVFFGDVLQKLTYIAPFRASPERDRRNPEPSASLDSRGAALLPFLDALSPSRLKDLSGFVNQQLNWQLRLHRAGPMVELHVSEDELPWRNIADVGFGVGQVLPVMVHLWNHVQVEPSRPRRRKILSDPRFSMIEPQVGISPLIIEQPELHLHPAHQYSLGRTFARVAALNRDRARLIVETHSQELLNAVGEAVERQDISQDDVTVVLFDRPPGQADARVRLAHFDEKGYLDGDWPYGFFQPKSL